MGHIVRSKLIPSMKGVLIEEYPNGNYRIRINNDQYVYGHKDSWVVVL